jgi:crotonobetainyl-CoA:carnitine CoA-transferase CaiB-like acyl-CoA transferase
MKPLEGLTVLDFSTLLPGPLSSLMMVEAGAQVIKIERPGTGDEMRSYEPRWGEDGVNFALLNRGKKSLAIDLKSAAALEILRPMLEQADILLEQFRPGVMERLGLGYDAVRAINPRIIYCSVTGYGQTGPKRDRAGHDLNYIGDTGLLHLAMGPAETPTVPPALIADIAGGAYPALINILLALMERQRSGVGRHIDVSMTDNLFTFMYWALGTGFSTGQWPRSGGELVTGGSPRYQLYAASDGRVVVVAALEQRFWDIFCDAIDLEQELRDDRRDPAATMAAIRIRIASKPGGVWKDVFEMRDCCCSVVASLEEAASDPHFVARGLFGRRTGNTDGESMPALPLPIDRSFERADENIRSPALGEHGAELLETR